METRTEPSARRAGCHLLSSTNFLAGAESPLHYVARMTLPESDDIDTDVIIDFTVANGIDINIRNQNGMTALEVAILSDNVYGVRTLLERGSSVDYTNQWGEQPLHFALGLDLSNKVKICKLLLDNSADAEAITIRKDGVRGCTPFQLFLDYIAYPVRHRKNVRADYELLEVCLKGDPSDDLIAASFGSDDAFDPHEGLALHKFLCGWSGLPDRMRGHYLEIARTDPGFSCLLELVRRGLNPFAKVGSPRFCRTCKDFASLTLYHTGHRIFRDFLINEVPGRYAYYLAKSLFMPCASRVRSRGLSLSDDLQQLLKRPDIPIYYDILPVFLKSCSSQDDEKADLLKVMLRYGKINIHQKNGWNRRPLELLAQVQEPLKWELAEILLSSEALDSESCLTQVSQRLSSPLFPPKEPGWFYTSSDFLQYLREYLFGSYYGSEVGKVFPAWPTESKKYPLYNPDAPYDKPETIELQRCVVHVLTKLAADGKLSAPQGVSKADQMRRILRARAQFRLRNIHIANDVILDILEAA